MNIKESKVSCFTERIKELLKFYHLSQSDFCKRTGLNKSVVSLYISGKREPMQLNIMTIAETFDIDPAWLMGLDVPMRKDLSAKYSTEMAETLIDIKNDSVLYDFITDYKKLTGQQQEIVRSLVKSMLH